MILPFSTQINGEPTYFPEKILSVLLKKYEETGDLALQELPNFIYEFGEKQGYHSADIILIYIDEVKPKLHTIREDKNDRWKPGVMIDFFINARQKNMFRFAPRIPVVSTQEIFMTEKGGNLEIYIAKEGSYIDYDDKYIYWETKEQLAINDGFDSYQNFEKYFVERIYANKKKTGNKWFSGKIIHWTDLKY